MIHYPHQTYLELAITLQFRQTEQQPLVISKHLVVRQKKSMNTGLVGPFVVKILFAIQLLDFTL